VQQDAGQEQADEVAGAALWGGLGFWFASDAKVLAYVLLLRQHGMHRFLPANVCSTAQQMLCVAWGMLSEAVRLCVLQAIESLRGIKHHCLSCWHRCCLVLVMRPSALESEQE
jgi:hypothetical protein